MNEAKLIYQNCGSHWAVGILCEDETLLEQTFNSFWNHGATSSDAHILTDVLWYFWTTPDKLRHAMTNAALFKLLNENEDLDEDDSNALAEAASMADKRISEMESDNFFSPRSKAYKQADPNDYYSLGTIKAENLSDRDA
jgi:hypothetical protein